MSNTSNDLQIELEELKQRADVLGIKYHPNIGVESLRTKVNNALTDDSEVETEKAEATKEVVVNPTTENAVVPRKESENEKRNRLINEMRKLIRVIVTPSDPLKQELSGELFSVGNSYVPTIKRFVPYNNEEGWHIEKGIYDLLVSKKYQAFKTTTLPNGDKIRKGIMKRAYSIEVLPALTKKELENLAREQAARNSIDKEEQ